MSGSMGYVESRRAMRMSVDAPARIIQPDTLPARVVNISATGILLHTVTECNVKVGSRVALAIPREQQELTLHGQVVRVESAQSGLRVAIDLAG